jgi:hypothetical protein
VIYPALVALSLAAATSRPVAFQKVNAIADAEGIEPVRSEASLDVAARLAAIPYRAGDEAVWAVEPRARYRETILEGRGNCSNLAFGLAYELDWRGLDYQLIHLMPHDFLAGSGHTVVRTRYRYREVERVGVVDLLEGGLPASAGRPLDVDDLARGAVPSFSIVALHAKQDARSDYYGAFLDEVRLGYITARDIHAYFDFIDAVYVPLGSPRLEKYVFDGLAVLAGAYPRIHVPDAAGLFAGNRLERAVLVAACWVLRSAVFLIPGYLALLLARTLAARHHALRTRAQRTRSPAPA